MSTGKKSIDAIRGASGGKGELGLPSGVVFTWAFLELVGWFWVSDQALRMKKSVWRILLMVNRFMLP